MLRIPSKEQIARFFVRGATRTGTPLYGLVAKEKTKEAKQEAILKYLKTNPKFQGMVRISGFNFHNLYELLTETKK